MNKFRKLNLLGIAVLTLTVAFVGVANATLTMDATTIAGSGNVTIDGVAASVYSIGATTTTGTITIGGTAQEGAIKLGDSTAALTLSLGTGASGVKTIHIGDGATANVITIGSNNGAGSVTITAGTGNFAVTGAAGTTYTIGATTTTGATTIGQSTKTNTINVGNGATEAGLTQTVSIANGAAIATGVTAVNIANGATAGNSTVSILGGNTTGTEVLNLGTGTGAKTIHIGDGAAANIITIGSSTGVAAVSITAGTGEITLTGGVRATGRQTVNKATAPVNIADTAATPTVAQILDAGIFTSLPTVDRTFTLPTAQGAAGLVQALPGTPAVGDVFSFVINNNAALASGFQNVVTAGAGATIVGVPNVEPGFSRTVYCRVTDVTGDSETISCY